MEGSRGFGFSDQGPSARFLWTGHRGSVNVGALQDRVVIDRCAAEQSVLTWTVRGGGTRNCGLRPIAIDPGILQNRAGFFQGLRSSIAEVGIKVPILVWGINGKLWVRYGASRVHTARQLDWNHVPAVLCLYDPQIPQGFLETAQISSRPLAVLEAFGPPSEVGHFVVDHERIDAHRMEP